MASKKTPPISCKTAGTHSKFALLAVPVLVLFPSLLTGCKFGNSSKITTSGYDTVSGYYATEPVSFDAEVQFRSGPSRTLSLPVARMPGYYLRTFTNPVILMIQSLTSGATYLVSKDNQSYYQGTYVNQDAQTFGLSDSQSLSHAGCTMTLSVTDAGSFRKDQPAMIGNITVRGRLNATRVFEVEYEGASTGCQELREIYHLCLTDTANCPNDTHLQNAQILYQSFLDAGIISTEEVKSATALRHTAKHQ